jgi:hypothetical protein
MSRPHPTIAFAEELSVGYVAVAAEAVLEPGPQKARYGGLSR